jgi:prophage antirepressor-like protein
MGNALTNSDYNSNDIRVVDLNGDPWFIAVDACRVLQMKAHNGSFAHHLK